MKKIKCSTGEICFTYDQYLRSAHWKNIKKQYYKTHEYICSKCGWNRNIQLHHISYVHVGNERMDELTYLCRRCHMLEHGIGVKSHGRDIKHMWILWGVSFLLIAGWIYVAYMRE